MPEWFGVLNRDSRYQFTCLGGFAAVYVAEELANSQFKIGGGRAGLKVSWQITGIRQDAWANAHRIQSRKKRAPRSAVTTFIRNYTVRRKKNRSSGRANPR